MPGYLCDSTCLVNLTFSVHLDAQNFIEIFQCGLVVALQTYRISSHSHNYFNTQIGILITLHPRIKAIASYVKLTNARFE